MPAEAKDIARAIQRIALARFDSDVDAAEVASFLQPILFEGRALLAAAEEGLVTDREVAGAVSARMTDWIARRDGTRPVWLGEAEADRFVDEVEVAIFGAAMRK